MSDPSDAPAGPPSNEPPRQRGRYRFQAGCPLDPDAGVHPEMASGADAMPIGAGIPNSPKELMALQDNKPERPEKPERQTPPKVKQVLDLINDIDTTAFEDQQIALALVRHLEKFHDNVVDEMQDDDEAKHAQLVSWAIDADRLMRCRYLLESVDLE